MLIEIDDDQVAELVQLVRREKVPLGQLVEQAVTELLRQRRTAEINETLGPRAEWDR